jgi:hypothetical protein
MPREYADIFGMTDALRQRGRSPMGDSRQYGDLQEMYPPGVSPANQARDTQTLQKLPVTGAENIVDTRDSMQFGDFAQIGFTIGTTPSQAPVLDRPQNKRIFLMIQNTDPVNKLFVGFGTQPSSTVGMQIAAGGSILLDIRVPQNEIYVLGSAAGVTGTLTYCNKEYGGV